MVIAPLKLIFGDAFVVAIRLAFLADLEPLIWAVRLPFTLAFFLTAALRNAAVSDVDPSLTTELLPVLTFFRFIWVDFFALWAGRRLLSSKYDVLCLASFFLLLSRC